MMEGGFIPFEKVRSITVLSSSSTSDIEANNSDQEYEDPNETEINPDFDSLDNNGNIISDSSTKTYSIHPLSAEWENRPCTHTLSKTPAEYGHYQLQRQEHTLVMHPQQDNIELPSHSHRDQYDSIQRYKLDVNTSLYYPSPSLPVAGPAWRMTKEERAVWQPLTDINCEIGSPFPQNFHWWQGVPFSHPFMPTDLEQTEYPGCVLLNHPCFSPREGEVRSKFGKVYFFFDPETTEVLRTQCEHLKKAIEITWGHRAKAQNDARIAIEEIQRIRGLCSHQNQIAQEWKQRTVRLSEKLDQDKKWMDHIQQRIRKKMHAMNLLRKENGQLQQRIIELEKLIAIQEREKLRMECKGCKMDPNLFMTQLTKKKEDKVRKRKLVVMIKDEIRQVDQVLINANMNMMECMYQLHKVNEKILEIRTPDREEGPAIQVIRKEPRKNNPFESDDSGEWDN